MIARAAGDRLKIAFVVHDINRRGGHNRYTAELVERMSRDHEVHLFVCRVSDVDTDPCVVHRVPAIQRTDFLRTFSFLFTAQRYCQLRNFDVVHSQGVCIPRFNVVTAHVCHKARLKASYRFQGERPIRSAHYWLFLKLAALFQEHWEFRPGRASRQWNIAYSAKTRQELIDLYRCDPDRTRLIYVGVDSERFHPRNRALYRSEILKQFGWPEAERVVLFVGAFGKGLGSAIEALAHLRAESRVGLAVIGNFQPGIYAEQIRRRDLDGRVRFVGTTSEIHKYFAAADVFAFPSLYDSFGFVCLEAMASGVPVVVSRQAGAAELVVPGENGFILEDPRDARQLAKELSEILVDADTWRRFSARARATAADFTWDRMAAETLDVYRAVAAERR
jgi:UDP-glucose:(heptosyl)LPS alpha-1,3-glucosyltransferase